MSPAPWTPDTAAAVAAGRHDRRPRRNRKLVCSPDALDTAKRMWMADKDVRAIAAATGVSQGTIRLRAAHENWPRNKQRRGAKPKRWTPNATETARRMWLAGEPADAIARALGTTIGAVLGKSWTEGWPRRAAPGRPRRALT
jgi:uncharacterized protein YjcR